MLVITTNTPELIEFVSPLPFSATVGRLMGVVENAGLTVFSRLDHAAGARNAGLEMPPSVVFTYGHARGSTAIMRAVPGAGLDLPLRTLVRESADGAVLVSFHPIEASQRLRQILAADNAPIERMLALAKGDGMFHGIDDHACRADQLRIQFLFAHGVRAHRAHMRAGAHPL
jgi:uncharacterized protein (DUF302 family)